MQSINLFFFPGKTRTTVAISANPNSSRIWASCVSCTLLIYLFMAEMCERDVLYSCGACGYALNLSSSQRVVSSLNSKALRKGTISFLCIDESRFKQLDELKCAPHVQANGALRLHQLRTKLLCGKCGNVVGHGHSSDRPSQLQMEGGSDSSSGSGTPEHKRYCVKIKALQPSLNLESISPAGG